MERLPRPPTASSSSAASTQSERPSRWLLGRPDPRPAGAEDARPSKPFFGDAMRHTLAYGTVLRVLDGAPYLSVWSVHTRPYGGSHEEVRRTHRTRASLDRWQECL